jgi:hypothetical protein
VWDKSGLAPIHRALKQDAYHWPQNPCRDQSNTCHSAACIGWRLKGVRTSLHIVIGARQCAFIGQRANVLIRPRSSAVMIVHMHWNMPLESISEMAWPSEGLARKGNRYDSILI